MQEQANEIEGRGYCVASDMMYYTAMAHTGYQASAMSLESPTVLIMIQLYMI